MRIKIGNTGRLTEILEPPGGVEHGDGDLGRLLDKGEVLEKAVRMQKIDVGLDGRLNDHLVRREHLLRRRLGAGGRLGP